MRPVATRAENEALRQNQSTPPKTKYLPIAFYAKITIHSIHPATAASLAGGGRVG
jgi:hypothetical protein